MCRTFEHRLRVRRRAPRSSRGGWWCGWTAAAARWDPPPQGAFRRAERTEVVFRGETKHTKTRTTGSVGEEVADFLMFFWFVGKIPKVNRKLLSVD